MKKLLFPLLITLALFSCNTDKDEKQNIQVLKTDSIQPVKPVHDSLTTEQIDNIKKIHTTFSEVYTISLEETLKNFKRDKNPDTEITIWLQMAETYNNYLNSKKTKLDVTTKKEVFKLILSRSVMAADEVIPNTKLTSLTEKEAREILDTYAKVSIPIETEKIH